jgi:hypothetical protein
MAKPVKAVKAVKAVCFLPHSGLPKRERDPNLHRDPFRPTFAGHLLDRCRSDR